MIHLLVSVLPRYRSVIGERRRGETGVIHTRLSLAADGVTAIAGNYFF